MFIIGDDMKLHLKTIMIIVCIILAFPTHFVYDIFPNKLTAIFFPINESIWEHIKILVTSFLASNLLFYPFLKNNQNIFFSVFIHCLIMIPLYLILFLPFYYMFGENLVYSIILIIIVDIIIFNLHFKFIAKDYFNLNIIGIMGIILLYLTFTYFSYHPLLNDLFLDPIKNKYGFNIYPI